MNTICACGHELWVPQGVAVPCPHCSCVWVNDGWSCRISNIKFTTTNTTGPTER